MKFIRWLLCKIGRHPSLDVINTFGIAQQVGCPYCRKLFAIHHGERAFLPWDHEFATLYKSLGHDVETNQKRWARYIAEDFKP